MSERTLLRVEKWSAWLGLVWIVAFFGTFGIMAHNMPPASAAWTAEELVANHYLPYKSDITIAMSLAAFAGFLYAPISCLWGAMIWQREKGHHALSIMEVVGGVITAWTLIQSPTLWAFCGAFAGEVDPDVILAIHTLGWYLINMIYAITTLQCFALGIFVLSDRSEELMFPRWLAMPAFFAGISFATETLLPFFRIGGLTYGGWWNFFMAAGIWGSFFVIFTVYTIKYVNRQERRLYAEHPEQFAIGGMAAETLPSTGA